MIESPFGPELSIDENPNSKNTPTYSESCTTHTNALYNCNLFYAELLYIINYAEFLIIQNALTEWKIFSYLKLFKIVKLFMPLKYFTLVKLL